MELYDLELKLISKRRFPVTTHCNPFTALVRAQWQQCVKTIETEWQDAASKDKIIES